MRFKSGEENMKSAVTEALRRERRSVALEHGIRGAILLALAVIPATLGLACRVVQMDRPSVMLTPTRDQEAVKQALEKALRNRGWTYVEEKPGSILATIDVRSHQVVSRITYTGSSLEFAYVSSKDMMYQVGANGVEKIHRNYNGWIANVIRDTHAYLEGRQPDGGLNQ
jgi:hypothetical protein